MMEKGLFQGREYTLHVPFGHRIFTPWFAGNSESEFSRFARVVRSAGPLVVSCDRCYILYALCRHCCNFPGDIAECGVYTGGTAHLLSLVLSADSRVRALHLFDTFSGMPETAIPERDYHSPGGFGETSLDSGKAASQGFRFREISSRPNARDI